MNRQAAVLFLCGVAIALGFAVWQYTLAPQGILLYTPAPGEKPNYTPSSLVGFSVAANALCGLSMLAALASLIASYLISWRFYRMAKLAGLLAIGFGALGVFAGFTENLWP